MDARPSTPDLQWQLKPFPALSLNELYQLLTARQQVFVVEQNCPYLDCDGYDHRCLHLWATDATGTLLALARLLPPGLKSAEASIGRVLTTAAGRGLKLGRLLMEKALAGVADHWPGNALRIEAQHYLEAFYQSLGFRTDGPVYDLDGIPHVEMIRQPA